MIFELRQYTLKPGCREQLIDLFDREFVDSQEVLGSYVVGQFRDLDRPDMFVWVREFADMETRQRALTEFYDGPVWHAGREAANATMIDTDDVYLLQGDALDVPRVETEPARSTVVALIAQVATGADPGAVAGALAPIADLPGVRHFAALRTEHTPNNYPRLPIREGENVVVSLLAYDGVTPPYGFDSAVAACEKALGAPVRRLRLEPTRRSRMR